MHYGPFGDSLSYSGPSLVYLGAPGYKSALLQNGNLYLMGARYYDPDVGRFISEDPAGLTAGINLYAFAGNDPVNGWDPSGKCPILLCLLSQGFEVASAYVESAGFMTTEKFSNEVYGCPAGPTQWPIAGAFRYISSKFGFSASRAAQGLSNPHEGIDFAVPVGTAVYPIAAGTVMYAGPTKKDGLLVEVDHGSDYISRYLHLSRINERVSFRGDPVDLQDVLGWSGSAGTGPHLHLELRYQGATMNPANCLP